MVKLQIGTRSAGGWSGRRVMQCTRDDGVFPTITLFYRCLSFT